MRVTTSLWEVGSLGSAVNHLKIKVIGEWVTCRLFSNALHDKTRRYACAATQLSNRLATIKTTRNFMKSVYKFIAIGTMTIAASGAQAQLYGEIHYLSATTKTSASVGTIKTEPQIIGAYIGYGLHENIAVEGLVGTGLGGADVKVNGASQSNPVTAKNDYLYGAYLKPRAKVNDDVELFRRVGYVKGKTTSSVLSLSAAETTSDWAYGVGANYYLTKQTYVTASWMSLYRKDSTKTDGWTIGLGLKF